MPYSAYAGALCLDGPTLTNLELLESSTGSSEGSLLSCLDSCASAGAYSSQGICQSTPCVVKGLVCCCFVTVSKTSSIFGQAIRTCQGGHLA